MSKEELTHSISSLLFILLVLGGLLLLVNFVFQPNRLLAKSRDGHRIEDLKDLVNATNLYLADNKNFDQLKTGKEYRSIATNNQIDGSGWVPLDIASISSGAPLGKLPTDPTENSIYNYRFGVNVVDKTFEFDCVLEEGANQKKMEEDGGNNSARYEVGTDLTILK